MVGLVVDNSILSAVASCSTYDIVRYVHGYQLASVEKQLDREAGKAAHHSLATYFRTEDKTSAMEALSSYQSLAEEYIAEDDRLSWINVRDVMETYYDTHPIEALPFAPMKDYVERGLLLPDFATLQDGRVVKYFALIDAPVSEHQTQKPYVMDNKTTGKISSWWKKKFRLSSQLTGYIWALREYLEQPIAGAYINAIELSKLPLSDRKCRIHSVPYVECRREHTKFELLVTTRSEEAIQSWRSDAQALTRKHFLLAQAFPSIEMVRYAPQEGRFNNSCTFCELRDFCAGDRNVELALSGMLEHSPWRPWAERIVEEVDDIPF